MLELQDGRIVGLQDGTQRSCNSFLQSCNPAILQYLLQSRHPAILQFAQSAP
jgi:hypothetical protein